MYKGCLADGRVAAVKKILKHLEKKNEDRIGDFLSELGIIAHISHPNVSTLIGFSIDHGSHLVLEFAPHGSLTNVLHGTLSFYTFLVIQMFNFLVCLYIINIFSLTKHLTMKNIEETNGKD